jgi:hypothetical protein
MEGLMLPTKIRLGRFSLPLGFVLLSILAASTLAAELLLVDRRNALFGRDYRIFHSIDGPVEALVFFAALIATHFLLFLLFYRCLRAVHRGRGRDPLFYFNFLFLGGAVAAAVLAVKFRILSYFSDAISLQIIRNLGGGSLVQALLYVADEAMFLLFGLAAAAFAYLILYRLLRLSRRSAAPPAPPRPRWRYVLACLPVVALILFEANRIEDVRPALDRFVAPWLFYAGLNAVGDFDRDGYSDFSSNRDVARFDSSRHPFALDIPGNGIDEDGLAGDFVYRGPGPSPVVPSFPGPRRHVILLVLESVRVDALTKRMDGRAVAPNLAAIAAGGSSGPEAYSHVGFTRESLKSLFSGRLEPRDARQSLFRDFHRNGYRVGILSGQSEDFGGIAKAVAMREESDVFIDAKTLEKERLWSFLHDINLLVDPRALLREMDTHFGDREGWRRPTFLYVNVQAAHYPYVFPGTPRFFSGPALARSQISAANRDQVARNYWNAVAYADWVVGQVVRRLKALHVYDDAIVVALGDHGEELFEDDYLGHGQVLNDLQTHIPLVVSRPLDIPNPVGLVDLRALLLHAAGAAIAPPADNQPVLQYIGELNRPSSIAMVEAGGRRTTIDLQTEEVAGAGAHGRLRRLPRGSPLRASAERLIFLWEKARWEQNAPPDKQ